MDKTATSRLFESGPTGLYCIQGDEWIGAAMAGAVEEKGPINCQILKIECCSIDPQLLKTKQKKVHKLFLEIPDWLS